MFKEAVARLMQREFGVTLDPATEVNHCIGSKTALVDAAGVLHQSGRRDADDRARLSGRGHAHDAITAAWSISCRSWPRTISFPISTRIPADIARKAKLLVLCYPNSPTGKTATPEFYERAIAFAKKNEIVIIQDAAHGMLSFDREPNSFLSVPGARDVGVEVHSLSKGYDMIGWRIGWVCGNPLLVRAFADTKDNFDSGQFMAIQKAAAAALDDPEIPQADAGQVPAADGEARGDALALRLQVPDAGRHVLPLHAGAEGVCDGRPGGGAVNFENAEGGEPVSHHRAIDLHGALGRRGRVPAVQRDVRSGGRNGGRRADGGDRSADQEHLRRFFSLPGRVRVVCVVTLKEHQMLPRQLVELFDELEAIGLELFENLLLRSSCGAA